MAKRPWGSVGALLVFISLSLLFFAWAMKHEPQPGKDDAEELTRIYDLEEFGRVEGSLLYTPKNYGFFNEHTIVVVEQFLEKGEPYGDQYILIKAGEELPESELAKMQDELADKNAEIRSKHEVQVYKSGKKAAEEWYVKKIAIQGDERYLSFIPIEAVNGEGFNFFTEGYERFKDF